MPSTLYLKSKLGILSGRFILERCCHVGCVQRQVWRVKSVSPEFVVASLGSLMKKVM